MKISFVCSGVSGGGAERVICNMANYFVQQNNDVELVTMSDDTPSYELDTKVSRKCLIETEQRRNYLFNALYRIIALKQYLKHQDVDAYVVMLPVPTIMTLILADKFTAPIIVSERVDPTTYSIIKRCLLKILSKKASGYVFQTEDIKEWYNLKKIPQVVIPNAINKEFVVDRFCGQRDRTIVGVGRLTKQKNFELLIRTFNRFLKAYPEYKLIIYGDGPQKAHLQEIAMKYNITGKVIFPGYKTHMVEELRKAGMFVLTSDYEGMPNALIEAMAMGIPCISTDCGGGGARFLIKDQENGFLVPIGDSEMLLDSMIKIAESDDLSERIGMSAQKINEVLSSEKIYGDWLKFVKQITADLRRI